MLPVPVHTTHACMKKCMCACVFIRIYLNADVYLLPVYVLYVHGMVVARMYTSRIEHMYVYILRISRLCAHTNSYYFKTHRKA